MNLEQRLTNLYLLYGERNAMFYRGSALIYAVNDSVLSFSELARRGETNKEVLGPRLAEIFEWIAAYADSFIHLPMAKSLAGKYPLVCCAYCGDDPCTCDFDRKTPFIERQMSLVQLNWDVREWCVHLDRLYGQANRKRGLGAAIGRLVQEIQEVGRAHLLGSRDPKISSVTFRDLRKQIAWEFADSFAWVFSISAMIEVDLQSILDCVYGTQSEEWTECFSRNSQ